MKFWRALFDLQQAKLGVCQEKGGGKESPLTKNIVSLLC